jgi:hypothetical protein
MGLLDDAIREHLELKRNRGADPAEVEKQEREALGPIGGAVPVTDQEPGLDDEPLPAHEDEPPEDDFEDEAVSYDDGRVPLDDERDALRDDSAAYDDDPDPFADAHAPPPPEPAGAVRAPDPPPAVSQPTEQFSVEDLEEEEAPPADEKGEDVLDETPEFLQEAPEHDRLWFEQRPPRDFDF